MTRAERTQLKLARLRLVRCEADIREHLRDGRSLPDVLAAIDLVLDKSIGRHTHRWHHDGIYDGVVCSVGGCGEKRPAHPARRRKAAPSSGVTGNAPKEGT